MPHGRFDGFDDFAQRERGPLVAFAWSLTGDRAASEDLAQEALEAAWKRWDTVAGYDRPGAWARRVVANAATGRGRRATRERRAYGRWMGRPAATVELEPQDHRFWGEVRKLPQRQAQAVALHYLEDMPIGDIAAVLGCAEGTVKAHLHRGRLALARSLGLLDTDEGGER
ncbi:MAG TPA: sigma-70 family RNA polymerase sigma factor [Acidimicrobiales bacterium]|nr:sigma-70 family RNA polymerase sigma factor [Acidimicrobiales bacterium]